MYKSCTFLLLASLVTIAGCMRGPANSTNAPVAENRATEKQAASQAPTPAASPSASVADSAAAACYAVKTAPKAVLREQTFAIDFEPFRRSCFVTSYNSEYKDPPMESEFAIYRGGRKVFDFPDQFNGATFGCWIDAVAFQDVNADSLKDVIVVGKCSAKSAPYNENMVYLNDGKGFITRPDGNNRISEFTNVKDIIDFVEDNQQIFYK